MRVPLGLRSPVVGDVHLTADDRLDSGLARFAVELDHSRERAVVGERDGGHLEPRRLLHEGRDPARSVEDRVLRVDVQVDEGRRGGTTHGRAIVLPRRGPWRFSRAPRTYAAVSPDQSASARRRPSPGDPPGRSRAGAPSTRARAPRDRPRHRLSDLPRAPARTTIRRRSRALPRGRARARVVRRWESRAGHA